MKTLDRIILIVLVVGVWGLLGTIWLKPSNVNAHDDGHTHDYADSYHDHNYAKKSHTHWCEVFDGEANCY